MAEEFFEEAFSDEKEGEDDLIEVEEEDRFETVQKESEEFIYDEVKGGHGKKHILSDLNKKKLGKHEMDDLFCVWD